LNSLVITQAESLARSLSLDTSNAQQLVTTLKATAFRGEVSDAQMAALLIVAQQYGLNPWTKEIYAFPDKHKGIVPVVGVDGWSRIINAHPAFDGMDFEQTADACTCIIYRKDRSHPIRVTEYFDECNRPNQAPWQSHPRRMLRHKAMIQCARLAFGFVGIYEQDEAERIIEGSFTRVDDKPSRHTRALPSDSPERDEALAEATAAARNGLDAFRSMWRTWPEAKRALIGPGALDTLKGIAEKVNADSVVTDAEQGGE
jgi:phage recombination protein Bet